MIAESPSTISLREKARRAWATEQERCQQAVLRERVERRRQYREGLKNAIESSLGVGCNLDDVVCDLSDFEVDNDVSDGDFVARTTIDGLALGLMRRDCSLFLALSWQCPTCGVEPFSDTRVSSLEDLGSLLAYLPTLCACPKNDEARP